MQRARTILTVGVTAMAFAALVTWVSGCLGPRVPGGVELVSADDPSRFLAPTPVIDADHPAVVRLAAELTAGAEGDRERAIRLHDFVRDEIRFGWQNEFYEVRASEVLAARVGYCHTKSSLFVALLRAAGVPARPHFVDLDARLLAGLIDPGTPFVDHSYAEVWLGGRWVLTDSYIVDPPMFRTAHVRLRAEGRRYGYGVHADGTDRWDGIQDAFSQFIRTSADDQFSRTDSGVHADVVAFYRDRPAAWNPRTRLLRVIGGVAFPNANRAVERIRREDGTR
jgi:hypothetical protein